MIKNEIKEQIEAWSNDRAGQYGFIGQAERIEALQELFYGLKQQGHDHDEVRIHFKNIENRCKPENPKKKGWHKFVAIDVQKIFNEYFRPNLRLCPVPLELVKERAKEEIEREANVKVVEQMRKEVEDSTFIRTVPEFDRSKYPKVDQSDKFVPGVMDDLEAIAEKLKAQFGSDDE